jgi:hypothetical protein
VVLLAVAVLFVRDQRATIWAMPSVLDLELTRLRAMSATEKVASMHALWRQAWSLTSAGVLSRHPDWSPGQIEAEVREIFRRDPQ